MRRNPSENSLPQKSSFSLRPTMGVKVTLGSVAMALAMALGGRRAAWGQRDGGGAGRRPGRAEGDVCAGESAVVTRGTSDKRSGVDVGQPTHTQIRWGELHRCAG